MEQTQSTPTLPDPSSEQVITGVQYAGFWSRVLASIVDGLVVGTVAGFIAFIFGSSNYVGQQGVVQAFVLWLYFASMESSSAQGTLGKQILSMKVTDYAGARISFAHATGRHFAKILSCITFGIGFFMVGFTEKKQGLHDIVAKTLVVKK